MSTDIAVQSMVSHTQSLIASPTIPIVDIASDPLDIAQQTISNAAITTGVVYIRNLLCALIFPLYNVYSI